MSLPTPYYDDGKGIQIHHGDAIAVLAELPAGSVHCCVTSPPYWGLRDYGTATWDGGDDGCDHKDARQVRGATSDKQRSQNNGEGGASYRDTCGKCGARRIDAQLGLEATPDDYVAKMVEVFRAVKRVLRDDGTLWVNMGDSYAQSGGHSQTASELSAEKKKGWFFDERGRYPTRATQSGRAANTAVSGLKPKDLCGIPWRLAFALQADGWWLRQDIIWNKPNPMPESVTDRCTKAHEYIFLMSKSARYYFDAEAIKEPLQTRPHAPGNNKLDSSRNDRDSMDKVWGLDGTRNKRSVWTVNPKPYPQAHFATFPPKLIEPCIKAGTSERGCCAECGTPWMRQWNHGAVTSTGGGEGREASGVCSVGNRGDSNVGKFTAREHVTTGWRQACGCDTGDPVQCTVLDPFMGSGTTAEVARNLGCAAIGIELNAEYIDLCAKRLAQDVFEFSESTLDAPKADG